MASNVPESKTLIRSVIDALRGTPSMFPRDEDTSRNLSDLSPETSQNEEDLDKQLDEIGNEATDNEELRHDGRAELGRQEREIFPRVGSATDPRFRFQNNDQTNLSPYFHHPPSPGQGFQDRGLSSSSVPVSYQPRGNLSVRKSLGDQQNVTVRESRRPKEREKDKEYRRLTLTSNEFTTFPLGNPLKHAVLGRVEHSPVPSVPSPGLGVGGSQRMDQVFQITLVYNGQNVRHQVYESMPIITLMEEAGSIFGLDPAQIVLMLFSLTPVTLDRNGYVSGPPRVSPNSTVFVFAIFVAGQEITQDYLIPPARGARIPFQPPPPPATSLVSSKLLAAFKLPKFDGSPRHWKAWDRALQRFLGLHQLDYVLQEDFLSLLPHPDAANANKIVYFLIEEAVTVGTLAAKYIRQAPKWSGHDAYILLYNRFVFSGPQTSTILLAELSNIRFLRDESPSEFCIRLVELLEELETVPGTAAVCMNDTQKLGYLLSAIRHETSLQAVYVQLQKDQLKGTVTFEEACDELHHRCDAIRADEYLDTTVHGERRVLVSSGTPVLVSAEIKKQN